MPTCSAFNCRYKHINKKSGKTVHMFPFTRPEILKKWVHNVGRKDWFPSRSSVLCSDHFEKHCFTNVGGLNVLLKKDAVPTLFCLPSHLKRGRWLWTNLEEPEPNTSTAHDHLSYIKREEINLPTEETPQENLSNILSLKHEPLSSSRNTKPKSLTDAPHVVKCNIISNKSLSDSVICSPNEVHFGETSTKESSSRFIKIDSYRSLNCGSIPVVKADQGAIPKILKLERTLKIANETIQEYRNKLKVKQQNIRRLNKRIISMRKEINYLRKENFLTEHTADLLKQNFSGLPLDIMLRKLKNKKKLPYSSSLQSFALTLYRYSPKAYRYVESVFDNTLPKSQAVRRWRSLEKKRELADKSDSSLLTTIDEVPPKENNCISDHTDVLQPGDNCILKSTDELSSEDICVPNNVIELQSKDSNILEDTDNSKLEENSYILLNGNELQTDGNGIVIVDKELQPIPNCFVCVTNYDKS